MKKTALAMCIAVLVSVFAGITASAKVGDVVGNIYATDIKAVINGVEVDSYNIGGKTVVIIEDITNQYAYSDSSRTLAVWDFAPDRLVKGGNSSKKKSGAKIGKIYETDIKTIFRGKELRSYSLNGKMAVEIEELGSDNSFSEIGGKYIWNPEERVISLEVMYRYTSEIHDILREKSVNMVLNQVGDRLEAEFVPVSITNGSILGGGMMPENSITQVVYKGEVIGYKCRFPNMELTFDGLDRPDGFWTDVDYYYADKIREAVAEFTPVIPTAEEWATYYEQNMYSIRERFETDDYMFLYMSLGTPHGGSHFLMKFDKKTAEVISYNGEFESVSLYGIKLFEDVRVDEEKEKVYLHYDYDYEIDLKTDKVSRINQDDGKAVAPSQDNIEVAKNSQAKARLISGDEEKSVNCFTAYEYYYATMLPMEETFDFLSIGYSFENNVLTIDTKEAKSFSFELTDEREDFIGDSDVSYLEVDKVIVDGEESRITYQYISGHFENTTEGLAEAIPYVIGGKVYINSSFISGLCK